MYYPKRRHASPPYFFTGRNGKFAAKVIICHLIEVKLQWSREEIFTKLSRTVLEHYRLSGMVKLHFHGSIFEVLDNAYPNEFMPWELIHRKHPLYR